MIAQPLSQRADTTDALQALAGEQDALAATGRQRTYTQAEIARRAGLTRSGVEQLEMTAKLRFLTRFAKSHPQSFLDLGGTRDQLAFLRSITVSSTNVRQLWRRWRRAGL